MNLARPETMWSGAPSATASAAAPPADCHVVREGRHVYFCSTISDASAFCLMKLLREAELEILSDVEAAKADFDQHGDKHKNAEITIAPLPIVLTLTTHGGAVHAALAVVDAICSLAVPVHTVIAGYVASAGTLISLAGDRRLMGVNALALLHEVRSAQWGKFTDLQDGFKNTQQVMQNIINYYAQRTCITKDDLASLLTRDRDWSPEECLKRGVIDEIIMPASRSKWKRRANTDKPNDVDIGVPAVQT